MTPTQDELARRDAVVRAILHSIRSNETIRLPDFDPALSRGSDRFALHSVGIEPNTFGGTVGNFRYQFEGEEDLLHLIVTRKDGAALIPEEAQAVANFLLPNVAPGLIWLKPGTVTQHLYVGHDELLDGFTANFETPRDEGPIAP